MSPSGQKTKAVRFECKLCGACCSQHTLIVTMNGRDIVRLVDSLGLSYQEALRVLDFYVLPEGTETPAGLQNIPQVKTERGLAYIALRKEENGTCIFLKDNMCMIHVIRPTVCASFPFVFSRDPDDIIWGLSAMQLICPGIGEGKPVSEIYLHDIGTVALEELDIFREFSEEWNLTEHNPTASGLVKRILEDVRFSV
jgi:Fe-S-cluster containining protein